MLDIYLAVKLIACGVAALAGIVCLLLRIIDHIKQ